eukprot:2638384-Rhodomonas_salina.1
MAPGGIPSSPSRLSQGVRYQRSIYSHASFTGRQQGRTWKPGGQPGGGWPRLCAGGSPTGEERRGPWASSSAGTRRRCAVGAPPLPSSQASGEG